MTSYKPLSRFVLTRGLILSALLLCGTLLLTRLAGQGSGMETALLYQSAQVFHTAALVAFGCGTCGSVLMEDLLRYFGE